MSEQICDKCHEEIKDQPIRYDKDANYHEILNFLMTLEHSCKTTLDVGIHVKDFLEKNREKFSAYKTPF